MADINHGRKETDMNDIDEERMANIISIWIANASWVETAERDYAYVHIIVRGITKGNALSLHECLKIYDDEKPYISQKVAYLVAKRFADKMTDTGYLESCKYELHKASDIIEISAVVRLAEGEAECETEGAGEKEYI